MCVRALKSLLMIMHFSARSIKTGHPAVFRRFFRRYDYHPVIVELYLLTMDGMHRTCRFLYAGRPADYRGERTPGRPGRFAGAGNFCGPASGDSLPSSGAVACRSKKHRCLRAFSAIRVRTFFLRLNGGICYTVPRQPQLTISIIWRTISRIVAHTDGNPQQEAYL